MFIAYLETAHHALKECPPHICRNVHLIFIKNDNCVKKKYLYKKEETCKETILNRKKYRKET